MTTINLGTLAATDGAAFTGLTGTGPSTVTRLGDVNGDGRDDFAVSGSPPSGSAQSAYVVFGRDGDFAATTALGSLAATDGFRIDGQVALRVAAAGDVNGDGLEDILVGSSAGNTIHVVYGRSGGFTGPVSLATLALTEGVRINPAAPGTLEVNARFAAAGDVNGDGVDDLVIGAPTAQGGNGEAYIVYGKTGGFAGNIALGALATADGVRLDAPILAAGALGRLGQSVAAAGDLNGDGIGDLLIGAPTAAGAGGPAVDDRIYVLYGRIGGWTAPVALGSLTADQGFRIVDSRLTEGFPEQIGAAVAGIGDFNGDGRDDILIGAPSVAASLEVGATTGGGAYVLYGPSGPVSTPVELANLAQVQGTWITGLARGSSTGAAVASAGDVNGDGLGDIIIGAPGQIGFPSPGAAFVVYGKAGGYGATLPLAWLSDEAGFTIAGFGGLRDQTGAAVSGAGDVNGDGFGDVIVSRAGATPRAAYIVYGPAQPIAWTGTSANETRSGAVLDDALHGRGGDDSLSGLAGADTLLGGGGRDTLVGGQGQDVLDGGAGNDNLQGGTEADTLLGGSGNDTLDGGTGADVMLGGGGNDVFIVDDAADVLVLGPGGISVVQSSVTWTLATGFNNLILTGTAALDGTGNTQSNFLTGNEGANRLLGLNGGDVVQGMDGDDTLIGGGGEDVLVGGAGRDSLSGGAGDDLLEGSPGIDTMTGGVGADAFVYFETPIAGEADRITDFNAAEGDYLDIRILALDPGGVAGLVGGTLSAQPGRFEANLSGAATLATTRFTYETDAGRLYWDPDGTGAEGRLLIATLIGTPALTDSDIVLF